MKLLIKSDVPVYNIIRFILIIIITFTLSTGITFPVVSLKVNEKSLNSKDKNLDETNFCYLNGD